MYISSILWGIPSSFSKQPSHFTPELCTEGSKILLAFLFVCFINFAWQSKVLVIDCSNNWGSCVLALQWPKVLSVLSCNHLFCFLVCAMDVCVLDSQRTCPNGFHLPLSSPAHGNREHRHAVMFHEAAISPLLCGHSFWKKSQKRGPQRLFCGTFEVAHLY